MKRTEYFGMLLEYNETDKSLTVNGKTFDASYMQQANKELKNVNRIHKPIGLLFWIDCKNGNAKNWNLI